MGIIFKNVAYLLGAQASSWSLMIIMMVLVPHYLGAGQYGRLSFAVAFVGFFGLLAGLGGPSFITKEVARDRSRLGSYVFNALVMNILLMLLLFSSAIAILWRAGYPRESCVLVVVVCVGMGLNVLSTTMIAGLQGEQRMAKSAAWGIVGNYESNGAVILALVTRQNLPVVAAAQFSSSIITLIANGRQLVGRLGNTIRIDLKVWTTLAKGGLPFLLWNVVFTIYGSIDVVMLSYMAGDTVVGWYTLAYKLIGIPIFLPSIIMTAFFPTLSAEGARRSPAFSRLSNQAIRLVSLGCIPMAAGIALISGDIVSLLRYPAGFSHSIPLIRILALHVPSVAITTILAATIAAADRQSRWVVVGVIAAIVNLLLNLVAIPLAARLYGNAAIGASVVTVITELVMLTGAVYLRPAGVLDRATAGYLVRCLLACVPMVLAVLLVGRSSLLIRVAVAVASYGVGSLALRTVSLQAISKLGGGLLRPAPLAGA